MVKLKDLRKLTWQEREKDYKEKKNKRNLAFRRSPYGMISTMYSRQLERSINRGHQPPNYSREEFSDWMLEQPHLVELYDNWVISGYETNLVPSIDRLNESQGYSFDNIELVTWAVNNTRRHINSRKKVYQFTIDNTFITSYTHALIASQHTKIHISAINKVCRGVRKTAGGYIWKYTPI